MIVRYKKKKGKPKKRNPRFASDYIRTTKTVEARGPAHEMYMKKKKYKKGGVFLLS